MAKERKGYVYLDTDGKLKARLTYTDADGKRRNVKRTVETKTEGRQILKKLIAELENEGEKSIEANKLIFSELAEIYEKRKIIAPKYVGDRKVAGLRSRRQVLVHLKPLIEHFGRKKVKVITANDVEDYKLKRLDIPTKDKRQRAIASVNRELSLLRAILNYAKSESWILRSPFEARSFALISMSDENKRDRILSFAEEKRLLAVCEIPLRRHLKAVIITALDTGMRKGELLSLTWKDIDFSTDSILIRATNTKTQTERIVGMTPTAKRELMLLWELSPKILTGKAFGVSDVKRSFATACRLAGIEEFNFHDLRHTAITRMVAAGSPTAEIMKTSGHTQMATFQRYVNPTSEAAKRNAARLADYNAAQMTEIDDADSKFIN